MLDLLEKALRLEHFSFVRIDGSCRDKQRRESIDTFRNKPSCTILIATIKSAGVGQAIEWS